MPRIRIPKPHQTVRRSLRVPAPLDARIRREADASQVSISHAMIILMSWGIDAIEQGTAELADQVRVVPTE